MSEDKTAVVEVPVSDSEIVAMNELKAALGVTSDQNLVRVAIGSLAQFIGRPLDVDVFNVSTREVKNWRLLARKQ